MKNLSHILILATLLVSTGCLESSEYSPSSDSSNSSVVSEKTVLLLQMRLRGPYSETHTAFYQHIDKYLQLKEKNPALALEELKKAVSIQYEEHPKSHEYLILLFKLHAAGKATLPQTLTGNKLVLEMMVDNGFSAEIIRLQKRSVAKDEQRIQILKDEGKDPDEHYFRFIFIPTE